jgi:hypothetical protein
MALKTAEEQDTYQFENMLICMTFCTLVLEAAANTFGKQLVDDWTVYDRKSPIEKLQKLSSALGVSWNQQDEPFATAVWLAEFRKDVVHARPEIVTTDSVITETHYKKQRGNRPPSTLERQHVTLENAQRAMKQVLALLGLLIERTPPERWRGLVADGWTSSAQPVESTAAARTDETSLP